MVAAKANFLIENFVSVSKKYFSHTAWTLNGLFGFDQQTGMNRNPEFGVPCSDGALFRWAPPCKDIVAIQGKSRQVGMVARQSR